VGRIGSTETSDVIQLTPHNNPEDGRIQFNRDRNQRSHIGALLFTQVTLYCYDREI
jgi:hypothetical protein